MSKSMWLVASESKPVCISSVHNWSISYGMS